MPVKLTEALVRSLPLGSRTVRDVEIKGLMVLSHKRSKSYAVQGDLWRNKRKVRCIRITIGRTDRVSLREARARAREVMAAISRGEDPSAPTRRDALTLAVAWELYRHPDRLSPKTVKEYDGHLRRYLRRWLDVPLQELGADRRAVRIHHEWLTMKHGRYAANHAMRTFRALYNRALREDPTLPSNPVIAVTFNREERRNWSLSREELPEWWCKVVALSPIFRDLYLLLLLTGLRRGDACAIRFEDVDLTRGSVRIPSPKGGEARAFTLPLSGFLIRMLQRRRQENEMLFPGSPWVFPSHSGSGHVVEPKKRGLPAPHAYRHTYRTLALEAGIPDTVMHLLLNHKRRDVSFGYISPHAMTGSLKDFQERITRYLLAAMGISAEGESEAEVSPEDQGPGTAP